MPQHTQTHIHGLEEGEVAEAQRRAAACPSLAGFCLRLFCLLAIAERFPNPHLNRMENSTERVFVFIFVCRGLTLTLTLQDNTIRFAITSTTNKTNLCPFEHMRNKMSAKGEDRKKEFWCFYWWMVQTP